MKIQDLEKISAYFDGEHSKTPEIAELLSSHSASKIAYANFKIISKFIHEDSTHYLSSVEAQIEECWTKLDARLSEEEQELDKLLQSAFVVPPEAAEIDLWESISRKLDLNSEEESEYFPAASNNNSLVKAKDWELLLSESFKLPSELTEKDIWEKVSAKIDSFYHAEIFSENMPENISLKEKFIMGLSEYFDGEVSAEKAQVINNHLIECASCRAYYLNWVKLKNVLKQSLALPQESLTSQENFWYSLENTLFPEDNNTNLYKRG